MKTLKLAIAVCIVCILAACSDNESNSNTENNDFFHQAVSENNESLDERTLIEEMFTKQKEFHKISFLTGSETLKRATITYTPESNQVEYAQAVDLTGDFDELSIEAVSGSEIADAFSYESETIANTSQLTHEVLAGEYGDYNENHAILAEASGNAYYVSHISDMIDKETIGVIGNNLKTEAAGAYDILYDYITLDMEQLKFPQLNPENITVTSVRLSYSDYDETPTLELTYETTLRGNLFFKVTASRIEDDAIEITDEAELSDGTTVQLAKNADQEDFRYFLWDDGTNFYELRYNHERAPSSKETILAIIESSFDDTHTFASLDFLTNESSSQRELTTEELNLVTALTDNKQVANLEEEAAQDAYNEERRLEQLEVDKKEVPEKYPDHMRLGETQRWTRSDAIGKDDIHVTVNSFELVDELDGTLPEEGKFLIVNLTIEDLTGNANYTNNFIRGSAHDSISNSYQPYEGDYTGAFPEEFSGTTTADVVFDVEMSNYYRLHFYDGKWLIFEDEKENQD